MARITKNKKLLNELIPQYAANKAELDGYKKICEDENKQIKELMQKADLEDYEVGLYTAKYRIQRRETMDEDMLVSLFTMVPAFVKIAEDCDIVKTKLYIDFDALESAIYNGHLSNEMLMELDKAKEIKEVATLKVTKRKEKKDETD